MSYKIMDSCYRIQKNVKPPGFRRFYILIFYFPLALQMSGRLISQSVM